MTFGRKTFIAAFGLYALVIACVLWPTQAVPATDEQADAEANAGSVHTTLKELPFCGATMQLHDVNNLAGYEKACDEIAGQGGDTVMFVPSASMEDGSSNLIYIDARHTMSEANLRLLIAHAEADKLRVILMPIVLLDAPKGNEWRGTIHPDDWDDWFESYQDMILYYARLAQSTGVNMLVVGSELVSSEPFVDDWRSTIRKVRTVYSGYLTYSSNWDHYMMIQFWNDLDLVGMNSYWDLCYNDRPDVPVSEIERRWHDIQKDLFAWQQNVHRPIILLEAGWCSLDNAASASWDYTQTQLPVNLELQRRLYEAFFSSWWGKSQCGGFMMWEWSPEWPGGPDDKGYTPRGKPAAAVMKDWFAKPRWDVR